MNFDKFNLLNKILNFYNLVQHFFIRLWQKFLTDRSQQYRHEQEFLPAALEILETPPSPAGRRVAILLITLFLIALIWAIVGRVDMNAVASAQLVPIGGIKVIQPLENSIVREILVENGQCVKAGELLVALDNTESTTDLSQLQRQLQTARYDAIRYEKLLSKVQPTAANITESKINIEITNCPNEHKQLLSSQHAAYLAKINALQAQLREAEAMIHGSFHESQKQKSRLALLQTKAEALKKMVERNGAAKLQWLEAEQERAATQDGVSIEQERTKQYRATHARLKAEINQFQSDTLKEWLSKWVEAKDKIHDAELNIARYQEREKQRYLRSPVDGVVQELKVQTVGGVVQAAQPIMTIVPNDATLAIDAKVLNQDIGFVKSGQSVRLKVESFPYTKYGVLNGTVKHISTDATPDEKLGPVYTARIHLNNNGITARNNHLPIQAGMAVVAEIKTDDRRVIDYLLSPIKEVVSESFRER